MKRILTFCIILSALFCFAGIALAEDDCPYDDDYKYALKKALVEYLKDPQTSQFSLQEVKDLLGFYLREDSITNSNCTQGIKSLVEKADKIGDASLYKVGGQNPDKCDLCPDGTLCAEKNDKEQTCECKDPNGDNRNEYCTLKPIIAPKAYCDVCPDGTLCDGQNDKEQNCYCKDANEDGLNEHCYLYPLKAWPEPCDKCDDGTACSQANILGETCSCRDINSDGVTERCMLYADEPPQTKGACTKCPDGTACGQSKNKNLACSCEDANKDGKYESCKLKKQDAECTQCSDATPCGKANAYNQICRCTDNNNNNITETCKLMPSSTILHKCNDCVDGTACWKTSGNNLCVCKPEPSPKASKYYSCQLTPYCSTCDDETPCGQTNADGNACTCFTRIKGNTYQKCILECNVCADGTECGKKGSDGKTCVCRWQGNKDGRYMECLSRCDKCADGTACYKRNKDNKYCLCSGIDYRTRKYLKCEIWGNNQTTTTISPTTTTSAVTSTTSVTTIPTTSSTTTSTTIATTTTTTTTIATTSTTIAPEQQLTAANLLSCIKAKKGKLYTDTTVCAACVDQKEVFYNEIDSLVGPGEGAYNELAVEGASGLVPRWEYKLGGQDMTSEGCKSFPELNEVFQCNLIELPGYTYQVC